MYSYKRGEVEVTERTCPTCHARTERALNPHTGKVYVTYPTDCPTKDACAQSLMSTGTALNPRQSRRALAAR